MGFTDNVDIAHSILNYLTVQDISSFSLASRSFRNIAKGASVFNKASVLIQSQFGRSSRENSTLPPPFSHLKVERYSETTIYLKEALIGCFLSLDMINPTHVAISKKLISRCPKNAVLRSVQGVIVVEDVSIPKEMFPNLSLVLGYNTKSLVEIFSLRKLTVLMILIDNRRDLDIDGIQNLQALESVALRYHNVARISLGEHDYQVSNLQLVAQLPLLQTLVLCGIRNLALPKFQECSVLRELNISDCFNIQNLSEVLSCTKLRHLRLSTSDGEYGNSGEDDLISLSLPESIQSLWLSSVHCLRTLSSNSSNIQLEYIYLEKLKELTDISCLVQCKNLLKLEARDLASLRVIPSFALNDKLEEVSMYRTYKLDDVSGLSGARNLRKLSLVGLRGIRKLPSFSPNESLEEILLKDNYSLFDISGIEEARNLRKLSLIELPSLKTFPSFSLKENLEELIIDECDFDDISGVNEARNLRKLFVRCPTDVNYLLSRRAGYERKLPSFALNKRLEEISIGKYTGLVDVSGITDARNLKKLSFTEFPFFETFVSLSLMENLEELIIDKCPFDDVSGVNDMKKLRKLSLVEFRMLRVLPSFSPNDKLEEILLQYNRYLSDISGLGDAENLKKLSLKDLESLKTLPSFALNEKLEKVSLKRNCELFDISGVLEARNLRKLSLVSLPSLTKLPSFWFNERLEEVLIDSCDGLVDISGLEDARNLRKLSLEGLQSLTTLPSFSLYERLEEVLICGCNDLVDISGLKDARTLRNLSLMFLPSLTKLPSFSLNEVPVNVDIIYCDKLKREKRT